MIRLRADLHTENDPVAGTILPPKPTSLVLILHTTTTKSYAVTPYKPDKSSYQYACDTDTNRNITAL